MRVASKTGTLEGVRAEAAVVELDGRPFALAVDDHLPATPIPDGERAIGEVADAAFSYFERLAQGGAYGGRAPELSRCTVKPLKRGTAELRSTKSVLLNVSVN